MEDEMNIIAWCTCALVGLLLCGNVQAAERKGIAAVGLSRLSGASAGNLAAAVKDSGCRQFEFTFMPFFNPGNPFNNVDTLLAIPNVGKIETICLSWRDEEAMNDDWEIVLATLGKRAGEVNRHLNGIRHKVEKIVLVPMLEDQWTQARWLEAVHIIAGQLDSGDRIFFRRSVNSGSDMPPTTIVARLKNGTSHTFTSTRLEAHRLDHGGNAQVISNDGRLVFQDARMFGRYETKAALDDGAGESRSLADWTAEANATAKVSLLWRPGYNLFTRAYADSRITYQKPDEPLEKRADSDSDPAVNAFEREVLKSFLQ
jgi:hypothetical protein